MLLNGDINVVKSDISFYFKLREMEDKTPVEDRVNETTKRKLQKGIQEAKSEIEKLERLLKFRESENEIKKTENETIGVEENVEELENESIVKEDLETVSTGNSFLSILRENESKYKSHGVYLEDVIVEDSKDVNESTKEDKLAESTSIENKLETVPHGVYVEDISLINIVYNETEKHTELVSHGIYIDEVEISNTETTKKTVEESIDYREHGVYLDDVIEEEITEQEDNVEEYVDEENYDNNEVVEEYEEQNGSIDENERTEENGKEDKSESNIDDLLNELFSEYSTKDDCIDSGVEKEQEETQQDYIDSEERERRRIEERERRRAEREKRYEDRERLYEERERSHQRFRGDTQEDIEEIIESKRERRYEERERRYQQFRENTQEGIEEIVEPEAEKSSKQEEIIVVPTNIRDFIKSNQGCSSDYVLKYYSKKDLSKAISMGKIYTKNGKLYV